MKERDFVVARNFFPWERPKVGDVVLARDPREKSRSIFKRVMRCEGKNYWLEGDNTSASTDSRTFGAILQQDILEKIVYKV